MERKQEKAGFLLFISPIHRHWHRTTASEERRFVHVKEVQLVLYFYFCFLIIFFTHRRRLILLTKAEYSTEQYNLRFVTCLDHCIFVTYQLVNCSHSAKNYVYLGAVYRLINQHNQYKLRTCRASRHCNYMHAFFSLPVPIGSRD